MKTAFLWLLIIASLVLHTEYEIVEFVFFGKAINAEKTGVLPVWFQVFSIFVMVLLAFVLVINIFLSKIYGRKERRFSIY